MGKIITGLIMFFTLIFAIYINVNNLDQESGIKTYEEKIQEISADAIKVRRPIDRAENQKVTIKLETKEIISEIAPGISYEYWTYNGQVPGPFLRVKEGDTVEIILIHPGHEDENNKTAFIELAKADAMEPDKMEGDESKSGHETHSIDLHSVIGYGGGATLTQAKEGETKKFEFIASHPGLYVYHCASPHVPTHIANGMYGMILVEPKNGLPKVDKEFYIMQGEIYTEGDLNEKGFQNFSLEKLLDESPEYYVFNGSTKGLNGKNALKVKTGENIRLYFGVGTFKSSNLHLIGGIFDKVYLEGDLSSVPHQNIQTTIVPAGGSVVVEFKLDKPGKYMLVDHSLTRSIDRGAVAEIIVE